VENSSDAPFCARATVLPGVRGGVATSCATFAGGIARDASRPTCVPGMRGSGPALGGLVRRQSSRARVARRDRSRPQVASQMPRRILWQTIAYPQVKRLRCAALALCRGCSSIDELRRVSESTRSPDHRRRLRAVTPNCRRCQRAKALGEENPRSVETSVSDCERSLRWRSSNSRRMSSMS
jgi:hypothetical protein